MYQKIQNWKVEEDSEEDEEDALETEEMNRKAIQGAQSLP